MKNLSKGADLSTAIEETLLRFAGESFKWDRSHISGRQLRELSNVPEDAELLVIYKEKEEHFLIDHDHWVDVVTEEVDLFYFRKPGEVMVSIEINEKKYAIKPGEHTVAAIKELGKIPLAYDLEQAIDGKLILLKDDSSLHIKGCEVFIGHPKDGSSS